MYLEDDGRAAKVLRAAESWWTWPMKDAKVTNWLAKRGKFDHLRREKKGARSEKGICAQFFPKKLWLKSWRYRVRAMATAQKPVTTSSLDSDLWTNNFHLKPPFLYSVVASNEAQTHHRGQKMENLLHLNWQIRQNLFYIMLTFGEVWRWPLHTIFLP